MAEPVECRSDFSYAQRPVALTWEGQRLEIVEVTAEWRTPDRKHFHVLTRDRQVFLLAYLEATDEWQIQKIEEIG